MTSFVVPLLLIITTGAAAAAVWRPGYAGTSEFHWRSILQQQDIICTKMTFRDQQNPFRCGGSWNFTSFLYKMGNTEATVGWRLVSSGSGVTKEPHVPLFCADEVKMRPMNVTPSFKKQRRILRAVSAFLQSAGTLAPSTFPSPPRLPGRCFLGFIHSQDLVEYC